MSHSRFPFRTLRRWALAGAWLAAGAANATPVWMANGATARPTVGQIEVVATLPDIAPSNATVSRSGRVFATVHGQRRGPVNVIEITGPNSWKPFPDAAWNGKPGSGPEVFNTANGIVIDAQDRLWVLDHGNWLPERHAPRLFAFDINTGALVFRHDFNPDVAPAGGLAQDLAVDAERGFVYVADSAGASPRLIVLDLATQQARAFQGHASLAAENVDITVEGRRLNWRQRDGTMGPARLAINPISLSADGERLYFGAMNGRTLYQLPTRLLRAGASDAQVAAAITPAATKPLSNGMTTDALGNHFVSNLPDNAVDWITTRGETIRLAQDSRMLFPDSLRFGPDGWLYVLSTQLHRAPIFTGQPDTAVPPYLLKRIYTGTRGQVGR